MLAERKAIWPMNWQPIANAPRTAGPTSSSWSPRCRPIRAAAMVEVRAARLTKQRGALGYEVLLTRTKGGARRSPL